MKKFIMVAFIAASIGLGFISCDKSDEAVPPILTQSDMILGNWKLEKTITYDKDGTVIWEEVEVINDCTKDNKIFFSKDEKVNVVANYFDEDYNTCDKYSDTFKWAIVNNKLLVTDVDGDIEESTIVKLNKEVFEMEIEDYDYDEETGQPMLLRLKIIYNRIK